jgi:hypothetical protein
VPTAALLELVVQLLAGAGMRWWREAGGKGHYLHNVGGLCSKCTTFDCWWGGPGVCVCVFGGGVHCTHAQVSTAGGNACHADQGSEAQ